jgi:hypothetical protein
MAIQRDLKAFVRYDGSGRVVAGSLILRKNKPKVGRWQEIPAYECCNYIPTPTTTTTTSSTSTTTSTSTSTSTTTSTSTSTSTTTTTTTAAPVFSVANQRWGDTQGDACGSVNPLTTFYTTGPLQSGLYLQDGNVIYLDEALTQPVQYPYILSPGIGRLLDCTNGVLSNQRNC